MLIGFLEVDIDKNVSGFFCEYFYGLFPEAGSVISRRSPSC
jgi:hypothetical protein